MNIIPVKYTSLRSISALKFIFSAIVIVLVIASFYTYRTFIQYEEDVGLRINSARMIRTLKEIEVEVLKAETGHRGYQLTRNPDYLEPYVSTRNTIFKNLEVLDSLSLDASLQEQRIDSLTHLVQRQYAIIEEIISVERGEGQTFTQYEIDLLAFDKQNMEIIRTMIHDLEQIENRILDEQISQLETRGQILPVMLTAINILSLAVIISVFFYIYKLLKQKTKAEDELKQRQVQLVEAERMANVGNWRWDIAHDSIEWSDGLYQIYQKSPVIFKPDKNSFEKYLHPDDRKLVMQIIDEAKRDKKSYTINFRVKLENGSIRYAHMIGNPIINDENDVIGFYGVTQDITEQKNSELKILEQSEELKRSNEDLEQFAYVASHDLQEPLRKIRAFGDRLETKYKDQLEDGGVDYIERMKSAAERMQVLINDLLTYSRVSKHDIEFERHSLDIILNEVLEDLETLISENNARIEKDELPEIVCHYQEIKRLFQNIIGNAIKFKRPEVEPVVQIKCELLKASELEDQFPVKGNRHYYRITIRDNGIGFNEKYQERIFTIFQRLHGRKDYKGTGIGLAISRKIVTKHEGFILARGEENKGAEFIIILPKNLKRNNNEASGAIEGVLAQ